MKYADIRIEVTVNFNDNEIDELNDQAIEEAMNSLGIHSFEINGIEVVGNIRDTELPEQN